VESALVQIERRSQPAVDVDPDIFFPLVRTAFGQRRKMLRRSLAGVVTAEQMAAAGVSPESRPEDLGVEEWGALARAVAGDG
jgi:16S rRNA (adenine1518-N6/adenine1519-N6)-dimethyltransferase